MLSQTPKTQTPLQLNQQDRLQVANGNIDKAVFNILKYKKNKNSCYFVVNKDINVNDTNFMIHKNAILLFSNININTEDTDFSFFVIYRTSVEEKDYREGLVKFNITDIIKLIENCSITALYTSNNKVDNELAEYILKV